MPEYKTKAATVSPQGASSKSSAILPHHNPIVTVLLVLGTSFLIAQVGGYLGVPWWLYALVAGVLGVVVGRWRTQ